MRSLDRSDIYKFPFSSAANPEGKLSFALTAGPPSPENPALPIPAKVEMLPLVSILRTLWFSRSAI